MSAPCPVFGFDVHVRLADWVDEAAADALLDEFIVGPIEGNGLLAGGGGDRRGWRHTVSREIGQATEADRVAVAAWAAGRAEIAACDVGPLVDLSGAA